MMKKENMSEIWRVEPARRIRSQQPYFFFSLNARISALREKGVDVIRLDVGSPDLPPADFIIETMVEYARRTDTHGYTRYGGTPEFLEAVARYYQRRFGVRLNPETQVVGLIGSKEGIFNLTQAIIDPGDVVLVPDPGYVTYRRAAQVAGAHVVSMPLLEENDYLPDLDSIPQDVWQRAKLLWLNYPNNPTGATAPVDFFVQVVEKAQKYRFLIAHDAPYMEVCYDGYRAASILQVPGAEQVAVEFNSLSKTFNMAGWRLGMAVGNVDAVKLLMKYKQLVDSSHFIPLLAAGARALVGDGEWIQARNRQYQRRRDLIVAGLTALGWHPRKPQASLYVWCRLDDGVDETLFCERLLTETGVSLTPGSIYGAYGKGYVRVSLCQPEERIEEALNRLIEYGKKNGTYPSPR